MMPFLTNNKENRPKISFVFVLCSTVTTAMLAFRLTGLTCLFHLSPLFTEMCEPYSLAACQAAVEKLGLNRGSPKIPFAESNLSSHPQFQNIIKNSYPYKGCFYYTKPGHNAGHAFYGAGGTISQNSAPLTGNTIALARRPRGFDCN